MRHTPVIILSLVLSTGCGKFLYQDAHNGIPVEELTIDDARLLMTGVYNTTQYKPTFNGWALADIIGGDIIRTGASGVNTPSMLVEGAVTPDNSFITSPWNGFYAGLFQINYFISVVEQLPWSGEKRQMLGTGHFFRGLYYYMLVSRWRDVPIVTAPTEEENIAQTPQDEGWKFIVSELEKAVEYAEEFHDENYVSRQAAQGLLARTLLAMGRKKEAADIAEELIGHPSFFLDDFKSVFRNRENGEEIFSFANLVQESSVNLSSYYYTKESPVGGSYNFCPTEEAMDMFANSDKRKTISVDIQGSNNVLNKYCGGDAGHDPIYIVRIAEMYLISAEGRGLENGLARLNELRGKRGLEPVFPSNEEEFLDAVLEERRMELFGEGFRWFDLVRTGKYASTIGVDKKYTVLPIPARELTLNKKLVQHTLWEAGNDNNRKTDEEDKK